MSCQETLLPLSFIRLTLNVHSFCVLVIANFKRLIVKVILFDFNLYAYLVWNNTKITISSISHVFARNIFGKNLWFRRSRPFQFISLHHLALHSSLYKFQVYLRNCNENYFPLYHRWNKTEALSARCSSHSRRPARRLIALRTESKLQYMACYPSRPK